jgi:hypothetical protein
VEPSNDEHVLGLTGGRANDVAAVIWAEPPAEVELDEREEVGVRQRYLLARVGCRRSPVALVLLRGQ